MAPVFMYITDTIGHSSWKSMMVEAMIRDKYGAVEGKSLYAINTALLESIIRQQPFVKTAEVFSSIDGKLYVEVIQRTPIVRVINQLGRKLLHRRTRDFHATLGSIYRPGACCKRLLVRSGSGKKHPSVLEEQRADTSIKRSRIDEVFRRHSSFRETRSGFHRRNNSM